jgi:hypothetical protein
MIINKYKTNKIQIQKVDQIIHYLFLFKILKLYRLYSCNLHQKAKNLLV